MKRSFLFVAILLASMISAFAENVSVQTAQTAAQSFLNAKMGNTQQIGLVEFVERADFHNLYVFGNERCFVIIAGDDAVHPVLGYSTEGGFENVEMPEEIRSWLSRYEKAISDVSELQVRSSDDVQSEWNQLLEGRGLEPKSRSFVRPLIKTKWSHKKTPFNNLCPVDTAGPGGHARGGCGSGSMSQLMNYWEHPVRGVGSFSYSPAQLNHQHPEYGEQSANFGETIYDWDNMKNVYANGYTETEALAVATLIYHCAVSLQMNFGPTNSYSNPPRMATALKTYFDYSQSTNYQLKSDHTDAEWKTMLRNDLDLGRPVVYRGRDVTDEEGHLFICDGYDENDYFHFNFDWGGSYDGYYLIGNIYVGIDYDHSNSAIFNCYPNATSINPPVNVNASVSNRNVTVTWSSVPGAASYKLYRDENLVANNIHGTNYTESNVEYGTHYYYVKSVKSDADGTMSLRSNTAIADVHVSKPVPVNLQASLNGHNVNLSWQTATPGSAVLQYETGNCAGSGGSNTEGYRTSWAHRYPISILQDYAGMAIEKVAFYARKAGEYTVSIYKGDETSTNELVYQQSQTVTAGSWHDIVFPAPVFVDYTQDLWVVFSSFVYKPASYCSYSGPYHYDCILFSTTQSGNLNWQRLADSKCWLIKTYLTDGTYSYNLYRDNNPVATNLTGNTYTDTNLPDGFYDYHVTTNYFGGESDPSNTAHVQVGNPTYTISTSSSPSNGGTTSGGGTFNYNQSCTVTATPASGYHFVNWTENGTQVSTNANYTFNVIGNRSLVANFSQITYTVTTSSSPSNGGTTSGGGTFNHGQSCTVTATPASGYNFVNWTENGTTVSEDANFQFTVTSNRSLVANFSQNTYTVTTSSNPTNGGTTSGGGTFTHGQSCTVHATANSGYTFVNWTENGTQVSNQANYTFDVTDNRSLVANFSQDTYTVTTSSSPSNGGTTSGGGTFNHGQSCTVYATANSGYTFVNWTENGTQVSNQANYTFDVTDNRNLVANFSQNTYTVTTSSNPTNGGTTSGGGTFTHGQSCTVHAIPASGYNFVNWTENGTQVSAQANYTFTVTDNRNLVAHFTAQNYVITATADPENGGTVSGAGGYDYGETCHLTATANTGFIFLNWTCNGSVVSTNPSYSFTVTESASYVAHFNALTYTVNVAANPSAGGLASGGGLFNYGQSCTVHASANGCYQFDNWTEDGNVVSTNANYTFTVTGNRNLVANFSLLQYVVSADIEPADGGIVLGTGTYNCGEAVSLEAVANENHSFVGWWENGSPVSSNPTMVIIADDNHHFTASFALVSGIGENESNIAVYPNPANNVLFIEGDGIRKVTVLNALGQVVESGEYANQERVTLNTGNYEAGIYMLQIRIQNNTVRKQFIKQ